jgi:hypoxanthine phosphoribosyltransferase
MDKYMHEVYYEIIGLRQKNTLYFGNLLFFLGCDFRVDDMLMIYTRDIYKQPLSISVDLPI